MQCLFLLEQNILIRLTIKIWFSVNSKCRMILTLSATLLAKHTDMWWAIKTMWTVFMRVVSGLREKWKRCFPPWPFLTTPIQMVPGMERRRLFHFLNWLSHFEETTVYFALTVVSPRLEPLQLYQEPCSQNMKLCLLLSTRLRKTWWSSPAFCSSWRSSRWTVAKPVAGWKSYTWAPGSSKLSLAAQRVA